MPLAQRQDVIQALLAQAPHDPLADGVRSGRLHRCADALDAQPGDAGGEADAVDAIAVVDQEPGVLAPGRGLDHLAPDPGGGRVGGHVEVAQATAVVADQEEDVEGLEGQGLDHEEIGCPNGLSVVGEEGAPALAGRSGRSAAAVAADGACADGDAELEQLATDPLGAPVRVLQRHGGDQLANLGVQAWTSPRTAGTPAPEETPAFSVPVQARCRKDVPRTSRRYKRLLPC